MMRKPLGYMSGFVTILMIWFLEHTSVIIPSNPAAKPRILKWLKSGCWNTKFCDEIFTSLQQEQVFETFREVSEEEAGLLSTSYTFVQSSDILTQTNPSPRTEAPPISFVHSHRSLVGTPSVSASSLPSATTSASPNGVNIFKLLNDLESRLENRLNKFEDALMRKMSDVGQRLKKVEERLSGHRSPTNAEDVDEEIGAPTSKAMQNEGALQATLHEDEQMVHEISQAQEVDPTAQSLLGTLVLRVKMRQLRKRKAVSVLCIGGERKKKSKRQSQKKVNLLKIEEDAKGHHKMKRLFPWEEVVTISLDDSSDSDFEEHKQDRVKRNKKDCSSENIEDIMSEGTLIRMAGMYQEYMKRIPIPTFSGSVVPFTSWQSLAESLKQLYGQPLHYLTNSLLKQWDRERFGSDDERQPLDTVVHPVKAQTLIWLTEELHRLTASPHYLAKLWASDPMYHSQIDPFLSY